MQDNLGKGQKAALISLHQSTLQHQQFRLQNIV